MKILDPSAVPHRDGGSNHMSLLLQPRGIGRHRSRGVTPDVGMVGPVGYPGHEATSPGTPAEPV